MAAPAQDALSAELRFLLEEKGVDEAVMDALAAAGYVTRQRFALVDDDRASLRAALTRDFNLDPAPEARNRLWQVAVIDAWESAKLRVERERQEEADARTTRLPKQLGKHVHLQMRTHGVGKYAF